MRGYEASRLVSEKNECSIFFWNSRHFQRLDNVAQSLEGQACAESEEHLAQSHDNRPR